MFERMFDNVHKKRGSSCRHFLPLRDFLPRRISGSQVSQNARQNLGKKLARTVECLERLESLQSCPRAVEFWRLVLEGGSQKKCVTAQ